MRIMYPHFLTTFKSMFSQEHQTFFFFTLNKRYSNLNTFGRAVTQIIHHVSPWKLFPKTWTVFHWTWYNSHYILVVYPSNLTLIYWFVCSAAPPLIVCFKRAVQTRGAYLSFLFYSFPLLLPPLSAPHEVNVPHRSKDASSAPCYISL